MFEQLTERLQSVVRKLRGTVQIDDESLAEVSRELRLALLEADVNYAVVKEFLGRVRERALGEDVSASLTPGQQVIKIVHDELTALLGGETRQLQLSGAPPYPVMIVGLQGAGKTTTLAKLGNLLRKQGRTSLMASVDVHRPAAREQLAQLGESAGIAVFDEPGEDPVGLARAALAEAGRRGDDVLLLDTAGRLHVDEKMMAEAAALVEAIRPRQVLYIADALAGQDAVKAAQAFAEGLPLDGVVLTKLDGDARGGAALSIVSATGLPVHFVGVGERFDDLEPFHPERMASRILGMGDVLSLIERAQDVADGEEVEGLERKVRRGEFDLEDFRKQLRQVRRMGSLSQIFEMLPWMKGGANLGNLAPDESELGRVEAIIDSMTRHERQRPQIINGSRRRRIAAGSGTTVQEVNRLLKQFAQSRKLMKKLGKMGGGRMPFGNVSGFGL